MTTTAHPGYGSKLALSVDGVTYVNVAQLQRFAPAGSRQTIVDQTNISTPDNFARALAVRVDPGELDMAGVLDPSNAGIVQLGTFHASMALAYCKVTLSDGSVFTFQGYVSEYVPFTVSFDKVLAFTGKLRVSGGITGPSGAL